VVNLMQKPRQRSGLNNLPNRWRGANTDLPRLHTPGVNKREQSGTSALSIHMDSLNARRRSTYGAMGASKSCVQEKNRRRARGNASAAPGHLIPPGVQAEVTRIAADCEQEISGGLTSD